MAVVRDEKDSKGSKDSKDSGGREKKSWWSGSVEDCAKENETEMAQVQLAR